MQLESAGIVPQTPDEAARLFLLGLQARAKIMSDAIYGAGGDARLAVVGGHIKPDEESPRVAVMFDRLRLEYSYFYTERPTGLRSSFGSREDAVRFIVERCSGA